MPAKRRPERRAIHNGRLARVLPAWSTPIEPLYLYFASRRHRSVALRAFIAFLTDSTGAGSGRPVIPD